MKLIFFNFLHKTASMFAHKICLAIKEKECIPYFSKNNQPRNYNGEFNLLENISETKPNLILRRDYEFDIKWLEEVKSKGLTIFALFQTRNPFDTIISQYFYLGWIHSDNMWKDNKKKLRTDIQSGKINLFQYATKVLEGEINWGGKPIIKRYNSLAYMAHNNSKDVKVKIIKYEDMVLNYALWSKEITDFLKLFPHLTSILKKISPLYNIENQKKLKDFYDDPMEYVKEIMGRNHIRQALPDDHKRFLTADEITSLSDILKKKSPYYHSLYDL